MCGHYGDKVGLAFSRTAQPISGNGVPPCPIPADGDPAVGKAASHCVGSEEDGRKAEASASKGGLSTGGCQPSVSKMDRTPGRACCVTTCINCNVWRSGQPDLQPPSPGPHGVPQSRLGNHRGLVR